MRNLSQKLVRKRTEWSIHGYKKTTRILGISGKMDMETAQPVTRQNDDRVSGTGCKAVVQLLLLIS